MLIRANGEDILIEWIHPAYVIADNSPKENPKLNGKDHMATVPLTNDEMQTAIGLKKPTMPESVHWVPMQVKPNT